MELIQVTEQQAVEFGMTLKDALESLTKTTEIAQQHGDMIASFHRLASLQAFKNKLASDTAKALILSGAGTSYEIAESERYKIPDAAKLEGAIRAMQSGYLLSDEAGPHFSIIMGKGGVSVLIKEPGHRHKLKRRGCKHVDVKAAAAHMRHRPNAQGKFDMVINGEASCVLDGEVITVSRSGDFPMILPCYEADGPDGHEAKARRRLLRDLWAKVSGEFDPIELSEVEDSEGRSIVVEPPKLAKQPLDQAASVGVAEAFEASRLAINKRLSKDPAQASAFAGLWKAAADATTKETLRGVWQEIIEAKGLFGTRDIDELKRWCNYCSDQKA